jgi:hypothetical protein
MQGEDDADDVTVAKNEASQMVYGAVFSTVQDCLVHPRLLTRLEACAFIKTVTSNRPGTIYPKVITQQLTTKLTSEQDFEVRHALTVAIALCFERSALLGELIRLLDAESESGDRCRQVAVVCTVRVFRQEFTLEDAIGYHACSLEANMRVTNGIPLGCPRFLPVHTVNCVQKMKAST